MATSPSGLAGPAHSCHCPSPVPRVPNSKPHYQPVPIMAPPQGPGSRPEGTASTALGCTGARGTCPSCPQAHGSCSVAPDGIPGWRRTQGCCSTVKPEGGGGGALSGGSGVRSRTPAPNKALLCSRRRASGDGFLRPRFWEPLPSSSVSCPAAGALHGPDPDLQSLPPNPHFHPRASQPQHRLLHHLSLSSSSSWPRR